MTRDKLDVGNRHDVYTEPKGVAQLWLSEQASAPKRFRFECGPGRPHLSRRHPTWSTEVWRRTLRSDATFLFLSGRCSADVMIPLMIRETVILSGKKKPSGKIATLCDYECRKAVIKMDPSSALWARNGCFTLILTIPNSVGFSFSLVFNYCW